jgi:hypothetical protein
MIAAACPATASFDQVVVPFVGKIGSPTVVNLDPQARRRKAGQNQSPFPIASTIVARWFQVAS